MTKAQSILFSMAGLFIKYSRRLPLSPYPFKFLIVLLACYRQKAVAVITVIHNSGKKLVLIHNAHTFHNKIHNHLDTLTLKIPPWLKLFYNSCFYFYLIYNRLCVTSRAYDRKNPVEFEKKTVVLFHLYFWLCFYNHPKYVCFLVIKW